MLRRAVILDVVLRSHDRPTPKKYIKHHINVDTPGSLTPNLISKVLHPPRKIP